MAVLIKRNDTDVEVDVNISEELEPYLDEHFNRHQLRGVKLQACSPFRYEKTPSFAVNLENGLWIDSGADSETWRKGNFIKLLSFLQAVTYEEAEQYLWEKYRTILADVDNYELTILIEPPAVNNRIITAEELQPYLFRHPYLTNRGISEKVQRAFKVGFDTEQKAVVLPHTDKDGNIVNLKFRSVRDKRFFYLKDGQPIKSHVYGLHFIYKYQAKRVVVVESETDCLYLWSLGVPAIALSSASLSKDQERLLIKSPIQELMLAFDNDKAGYRCKLDVIKRLQGSLELYELSIPSNCKDVNDMTAEQVKTAMGSVGAVYPSFL